MLQYPMKYYLVITPQPLIDALLSESQRLVKTIYDKEVTQLYYRVQTRQILDNPRRLFVKGDGQIFELQVKPHISLVHNIELEDPADFIQLVEDVCAKHHPCELQYAGTGNYDMDFTFFVHFHSEPSLEALRNDLLQISIEHMAEDEYQQHFDEEFIPHATVLYDDVDPEKVLKAYEMLDESKFNQNIPVTTVTLWEVSAADQKVVKTFELAE